MKKTEIDTEENLAVNSQILSKYIAIDNVHFRGNRFSPFVIENLFLKNKSPMEFKQQLIILKAVETYSILTAPRTVEKGIIISVKLPDIFNEEQKYVILQESVKYTSLPEVNIPHSKRTYIDLHVYDRSKNAITLVFKKCNKKCKILDIMPYIQKTMNDLIKQIKQNVQKFGNYMMEDLYNIYTAGRNPSICKNIFIYSRFIMLLEQINYLSEFKIPYIYKNRNINIYTRIWYDIRKNSRIHIVKSNPYTKENPITIYFTTLLPIHVTVTANHKVVKKITYNSPIKIPIKANALSIENFNQFLTQFVKSVIESYNVVIPAFIESTFKEPYTDEKYKQIKREATMVMKKHRNKIETFLINYFKHFIEIYNQIDRNKGKERNEEIIRKNRKNNFLKSTKEINI